MRRWGFLQFIALLLAVVTVGGICVGASDPLTPAFTDPDQRPALREPGEVPEEEEPWLEMPADYRMASRNYFVYDVNHDRFLICSDPDSKRIYPASITKLFTIYVALQYMDPETKVTVGAEITMIHPDSTVAGLQIGDVVTVKQLVGGMLLPSGNDAAYAMAAATGRVISGEPDLSAGAAVEVFVKEMNRQAELLGMKGSHFANPDGIHRENHYFDIRDMATLGMLALQIPEVMEYAGQSSATTNLSGRLKTWQNTNKMLNHENDYYCPYSIGLKTGRTTAAGCCLISAFQKDDQMWLIGVFGCPDGSYRFADTMYLFSQAVEYQAGVVSVSPING